MHLSIRLCAILFVLALISCLYRYRMGKCLGREIFLQWSSSLSWFCSLGFFVLCKSPRSNNAAAKLSAIICTTACVERQENGKKRNSAGGHCAGDIVHLAAGDMIPADMRILSAKDLFISQSALTGESEPVEKFAQHLPNEGAITEESTLAFMGE